MGRRAVGLGLVRVIPRGLILVRVIPRGLVIVPGHECAPAVPFGWRLQFLRGVPAAGLAGKRAVVVPFLVRPGVVAGHGTVGLMCVADVLWRAVRPVVGCVLGRSEFWLTHRCFPFPWHADVPFLCVMCATAGRARGDYSVALRARSRTPRWSESALELAISCGQLMTCS